MSMLEIYIVLFWIIFMSFYSYFTFKILNKSSDIKKVSKIDKKAPKKNNIIGNSIKDKYPTWDSEQSMYYI